MPRRAGQAKDGRATGRPRTEKLRARSLPALLAVTALVTLGMAPAAVASGTVTLIGTDLVYAGDETREQIYVNKETLTDDHGTPVGYAIRSRTANREAL